VTAPLIYSKQWVGAVEQQKSWTADNPHEDVRSVRKQLQGEVEELPPHGAGPWSRRPISMEMTSPFWNIP